MLLGLLLLLVHQVAGELLVRLLGLPVPGPVVGLLLLLGTLLVRRLPPVEATSDALLRHLALLFVPAGVGVVQYGALLRSEALAVTVALLVSTLVGLLVTAAVARALLR